MAAVAKAERETPMQTSPSGFPGRVAVAGHTDAVAAINEEAQAAWARLLFA